MPKVKHNFFKLKLEFFQSDFLTVSEFLQNKGFMRDFSGGFGGNIEKNTRGWSKEKKQLEEKIYQRALAQYETDRTSEWQSLFRRLEEAELLQLTEFAELLTQGQVEHEIIQTDGTRKKITLNKYNHKQMKVVRPIIDLLLHIRRILGEYPVATTQEQADTKFTKEEIQSFADLLGVHPDQIT